MAFLRFAPLNVPLRRRIQTAALLLVLPFQLYAFIFSMWLLIFPLTFPFMVAYLYWIYRLDQAPLTGSRKWPAIRNLGIWRLAAEYFPVTLTKTSDLDPSKHYIFGYHPHGIISIGAFFTFATEATGFSEAFPGIDVHLLGLSPVTHTPFGRELLLWLGIGNVARQACEYHLNHPNPGRSIVIVIGGAQEALDADPDTLTLTIANRKGFVRVALSSGASLVPVLSFGENELFAQLHHPLLRRIQEALQQRLGWSLPIFIGRGIFQYSFGLLPYRHPIHVVFGSPIECPKVENPTEEQVDKYHGKYLEELRKIYEEHKGLYMPMRKRTLVFASAVNHKKA